jgi:hypothetical protein
VHCSSIVNIHVRAQKGYYLEQTCTKCTYKRHIAIKHEVDIHESGEKAIEKICVKYGFTRLRIQVTWTKNHAFFHPLSNDLIWMQRYRIGYNYCFGQSDV